VTWRSLDAVCQRTPLWKNQGRRRSSSGTGSGSLFDVGSPRSSSWSALPGSCGAGVAVAQHLTATFTSATARAIASSAHAGQPARAESSLRRLQRRRRGGAGVVAAPQPVAQTQQSGAASWGPKRSPPPPSPLRVLGKRHRTVLACAVRARARSEAPGRRVGLPKLKRWGWGNRIPQEPAAAAAEVAAAGPFGGIVLPVTPFGDGGAKALARARRWRC